MTLARNRKAGILGEIDRRQARFDNPTPDPRLHSETSESGAARAFRIQS
jgi:hypothetical protein